MEPPCVLLFEAPPLAERFTQIDISRSTTDVVVAAATGAGAGAGACAGVDAVVCWGDDKLAAEGADGLVGSVVLVLLGAGDVRGVC